MRFHVQPRDVPAQVAARRMGLTLLAFEHALPALLGHGFPQPDSVTGNFDLQAIDRYCDARNPSLFDGVDDAGAITDSSVFLRRIAALEKADG